MTIDKFLLLSGEDIPLTNSNIIIHHPTIKELANVFLYEDNFLTGFEFLFFSKDKLEEHEQQILQTLSDFEILLTLLLQIDKSLMKKQLTYLKQLLTLLFNQYDIEYKEEYIVLNKDNYTYFIDEDVFNQLKQIVSQIFPFHKGEKQIDFNPQNKRAQQIAEKIKKGREKAKKQKKVSQESLFEKYISILSVGLKMPINDLYEMTTYQLFNMFERYEKKISYDVHLKAQLAGATGMKEVDHWMM